MQPLISVDHESRHNSHQRDDDHEERPSEDTPLLRRFPQRHAERNHFTTIIISLLLIILISGVIIGIYLLVLQSEAENILPPIETPLHLVSRGQWDHKTDSQHLLSIPAFRARWVIVVQTDTEQCFSTDSCTNLLQNMQANTASSENILPYNFLVSSNGQTYEALGWHKPSPLFPEFLPPHVVLAFIGNFTKVSPTRAQVEEAKNFFAEFVSQQNLDPLFDVIGKSTTYTPTYLFQSLMMLPQWNIQLSDI